ncbi:hypothetical protein Dimus_036869 [Dionaea muscipula]
MDHDQKSRGGASTSTLFFFPPLTEANYQTGSRREEHPTLAIIHSRNKQSPPEEETKYLYQNYIKQQSEATQSWWVREEVGRPYLFNSEGESRGEEGEDRRGVKSRHWNDGFQVQPRSLLKRLKQQKMPGRGQIPPT